jgi:hypothetical protein
MRDLMIDSSATELILNGQLSSIIANHAKSDLDLSGIIKQAFGKTKTDSVLSESEWFSMARFYYKKMTIVKPLSVCRILADSQPLYDQMVFMQLFSKDEQRAKTFLQKLQKIQQQRCRY